MLAQDPDIMDDLKSQIKMNVPGLMNQGNPHHQTNNNTEAGDTESSEE